MRRLSIQQVRSYVLLLQYYFTAKCSVLYWNFKILIYKNRVQNHINARVLNDIFFIMLIIAYLLALSNIFNKLITDFQTTYGVILTIDICIFMISDLLYILKCFCICNVVSFRFHISIFTVNLIPLSIQVGFLLTATPSNTNFLCY